MKQVVIYLFTCFTIYVLHANSCFDISNGGYRNWQYFSFGEAVFCEAKYCDIDGFLFIMNSKEFGILMRVLKFMEKYENNEVMSELVREFQDEFTDEQMDIIISEFKFHASKSEDRKTGHKGPTPREERFDFF